VNEKGLLDWLAVPPVPECRRKEAASVSIDPYSKYIT
jgi:hypothetical protein